MSTPQRNDARVVADRGPGLPSAVLQHGFTTKSGHAGVARKP